MGIDLVDPPEIPHGCTFLRLDVLSLTTGFMRDGDFDFACASSPCEDFSKTCKGGMACFYPDAPYPELAIMLFYHTRSILERAKIPYVMENVRGAEQWVGNAKHHAGPFYLWGNAVPPLLPKGITKGTTNMGNWNHNKKLMPQKSAATLAKIPPELANCVADYAERMISNREHSIAEPLEAAKP